MPKPQKSKSELLATGGYRPDRHEERGDHPSISNSPSKPTYLEGIASELWDQIVPILEAANLATAADDLLLEALCNSWATYREARAAAETFEISSIERRRASLLAGSALKEIFVLASRFGLSPGDRQKIQCSPEEESDELDRLRAMIA